MTEANFLALKKDVVYITAAGSLIKVLSIDMSSAHVKTERMDTSFISSIHYSMITALHTAMPPHVSAGKTAYTISTRSLGKPRSVS